MIRFAHRGAPVPPLRRNTLAAFEAALRAGAEGVESDVHLTADGVPVLMHGPFRSLRRVRRAELSPDVPSLADLWERCGGAFELALDMTDPGAVGAVMALAERFDTVPRVWLTYWHLPTMAAWRRRWPRARLVYGTMLGWHPTLLRRTAVRAAKSGVDALNTYHRLIPRNGAAAVHAAGLKLFAWGLKRPDQLPRAARLGMDGVFIDDVRPGT